MDFIMIKNKTQIQFHFIQFCFKYWKKDMVLSISCVPLKLSVGILLFCCLWTLTVSTEQQCQLKDDQFFVTFHPHLDAFWLNTDDELKSINFRPQGFLYAMNQRNAKQILNSMYDALIQDEKRKYFVSEIVFFKDWYAYLDAGKKQGVKKMLKNGQLDISNSGWVENDEAVCYYDDILQQYTVGMNWMYEQFGYVNKIGWATDSFGHSHSQVALEHLLGFQFQGIERIDDRYIYQRKQKPLLEFYWQPVSDSNGKKYGGLVNHIRHFLHQVNDLRRTPPRSITQDFNNLQTNMHKLYGKNKLFRFLGNDFEEFVTEEFTNLQKSFYELNRNSQSQCVKYKYGNPKDYLETIKSYWSQNKLQKRQSDLIPNWDQDRYWSGYYTTDPELKVICKRFSQLVNLVRKTLAQQLPHNKQIYSNFSQILQHAEQLLAIMQHHDGITATSKSYIEKMFKDRMRNSSNDLVEIIKRVENVGGNVQECRLFENHNTCNVTRKEERVVLTIYHSGVAKVEKVEVVLPEKWYYTVQGVDSYIVASPLKYVSLVFEVELKPGQNDFVLKGGDLSTYKGEINSFRDQLVFDNGHGIKVSLQNSHTIRYQFGQNFMQFTIQTSPNTQSRRQTVAWDKYGRKIDKTQNVIPGIYIMSNNGSLQVLDPKWMVFKVVEFGNYYRLFFDGEKIDFEITLKKDQPSHVDTNLIFTPNGYNFVDYFLRVDSNVKNPQGEFYHDSNGYLVAKRKIGYRPDYDWIYKPEDKINANTYPACSFFYQISGKNKFIAFLDRAHGITTYDGSMLINIDRLAGDDYKGVGEGYSFIRQNKFNFKFAITQKSNDLQRVWQRAYDDSMIGFFTNKEPMKSEQHLRKMPQKSSNYLKYNVAFLNKNQILIRLHNLAENQNLNVLHFTTNSWIIPEINLNISFTDIKESFANGLIAKERYNWITDKEEINQMTRGSEDTNDFIVLRPLQVRSWRINLNEKIVDREVGGAKPIQLPPLQVISKVVHPSAQVQLTTLIKHSLRKRCF